jgi:hypothetical protein
MEAKLDKNVLFLKYIAGNTPLSIKTISYPLDIEGIILFFILRFMLVLVFGN